MSSFYATFNTEWHAFMTVRSTLPVVGHTFLKVNAEGLSILSGRAIHLSGVVGSSWLTTVHQHD